MVQAVYMMNPTLMGLGRRNGKDAVAVPVSWYESGQHME
jgi:hypothetical protein